jgi:hypothetical protein
LTSITKKLESVNAELSKVQANLANELKQSEARHFEAVEKQVLSENAIKQLET